MKTIWASAIIVFFVLRAAAAQSLGDLARQERERKAQQQKGSVQITTDEVRAGKLDFSPPLDPARKGDLDYLLQQLSHPKTSPELLAAFIPLKDRAVPKLLPMLSSPESLKRLAPATVLMVLGNAEGVAAVARLLTGAMDTASSAAPAGSPEESLRKKMEESRITGYALDAAKFGVWRFTEGSSLAPAQVVQRLAKGPVIDIVGGVDNGQRIFNRALRDNDPNLRRGAIALIRLVAGGNDFGYQPDQSPDQNESAIQQISSFLATERTKVLSQLGTKTQ